MMRGVHLNLTINLFRVNVRQTIEVPTLHPMRYVVTEESRAQSLLRVGIWNKDPEFVEMDVAFHR